MDDGSKHILYPLGGNYAGRHHPDNYSGLISHLKDAQDFINANGGIDGEPARRGDENSEVLSISAGGGSSGGGGSSSACFISTAADRPPCHR